MTEDHAEKILIHAHDVCKQLDEISEICRLYPESPSVRRHVRLTGEMISDLLNKVMIPALVEHPSLDEKLFAGRFDAKNFRVYPNTES